MKRPKIYFTKSCYITLFRAEFIDNHDLWKFPSSLHRQFRNFYVLYVLRMSNERNFFFAWFSKFSCPDSEYEAYMYMSCKAPWPPAGGGRRSCWGRCGAAGVTRDSTSASRCHSRMLILYLIWGEIVHQHQHNAQQKYLHNRHNDDAPCPGQDEPVP